MPVSLWIGMVVALATGLWMWAEYALGLHTAYADMGRVTGFFSIVAPIAGMILALRRVRKRIGELTFRSGMPHVLAVSVAAAGTMAAMSLGYVAWINPAWLAQARLSATAFASQGAFATLIGGTIVGLVVLALMRTRKVAIP